MKYCFYRMNVESGFTRNPHYGFCTLSACTPNHLRAGPYFSDPLSLARKSGPHSRHLARRTGDNVYFRVGRGHFGSLPGNPNDNERQMAQDTHGDRVNISGMNDFNYFGDTELPWPNRLGRHLPQGHGIRYRRQRLPALYRYVR